MVTEAPALLAELAPYLPWLGGGLALFGVLVILLLALYLQKVAAVEKAMAAATVPPPALVAVAPPPVAPSTASMDQRLDETFDTLHKTIAGARGTATPWVVMVGPRGSDVSACLRDAGPLADVAEGLPGGRLRPRNADDLGWWFFDGGMVLDVPPSFLCAEDEGASDRPWLRFLDLLCKARRRRPLDGVVLALPAGDFIGPHRLDRDRLLARGRVLHARLWQMQERVGFRLPLFILITGCDAVAGFDDFWRLQPADRRQEMFGWANPAGPEDAPRKGWLETAFDVLNDQMFRVQTDTAGTVTPGLAEVGGMVLFPGAVNTLRGGLETLFGPLFEPTVYHESACLRGLWLCGALSAAPAANDDGPGSVILVRQLLRRKVFAERGLARPTVKGEQSQSRMVRRLKKGLAIAGAVLTIGLLLSAVDFSEQVDNLSGPVVALHEVIGIGEGAGETVEVTARIEDARRLLGAMQALQETDLVEAFMPTTWLSPLRNTMIDLLAEGVGTTILGAMHSILHNRAEALLVDGHLPADKVSARMAEGRPKALADLMVWLDETDRVMADIAMFNDLSKPGGVEHLAALARSVLGVELDDGVVRYNDLFTASVARANDRPIIIALWRAPARARLQGLAEAALDSLTEKGSLTFVLTDLDALLATPGRPLTAGQARIVATDLAGSAQDVYLQQLTILSRRVQVMMGKTWWRSVSEGRLHAEGVLSSLLATVARNPLFGPETAKQLSIFAERDLADFRRVLESFGAGPVKPLLVADTAARWLVPAPALDSLATVLDGLAGQSFMALRNARPPKAVPIQVSDGRATWTTAGLLQALDLYRSYTLWQSTHAADLPATLTPIVRTVTRDRLDGHMTSLVNQSLSALPPAEQDPDVRGTALDQLRGDIDAFAPAVQSLAELQAAFDAIVRPVSRDTLHDAVQRSAFNLLQRLDDHLTAVPLYQPVRAAAAWNGGNTLSGLMYGAPDAGTLATYLQGQRQRADMLAVTMAGPPLEALRNLDIGSSPAWLATIGRWRGLQAQVTAALAGQPSTVVEMEAFLTGTLLGMTEATCEERLALVQSATPTADYILARRDAVLDAVWSRCDELNGGSGVMAGAYSRIARLFNTTMAGRYPFASTATGSGLSDVTPAEMHSFLVEWDSARGSLEAEVNSGSVARATRTQALAFIARMDTARAFLAPFATSGEAAAAVYDLAVQFRVNRAYEHNANQILQWQMQVGGTAITPATATTAVSWRWNQPVTVTLTWAKDSPDLPFPRTGHQPHVDGTAVSFAYTDPWALLSFLRANPLGDGQFDSAARPAPVIASLAVPTRPANATAPKLPAAPGAASTATVATARTFLHVALSVPGKDGKPGPALAVPEFPVAAPVLSPSIGGGR